MKKVYQEMAMRINAIENCEKTNNREWQEKHEAVLDYFIKEHMPSGSGIDSGVMINTGKSNDSKIVLESCYHMMNDNGMYDGWTNFTVTVRPSLQSGFIVSVKVRSRRNLAFGLDEYLRDTFNTALDLDLTDSDVDEIREIQAKN